MFISESKRPEASIPVENEIDNELDCDPGLQWMMEAAAQSKFKTLRDFLPEF